MSSASMSNKSSKIMIGSKDQETKSLIGKFGEEDDDDDDDDDDLRDGLNGGEDLDLNNLGLVEADPAGQSIRTDPRFYRAEGTVTKLQLQRTPGPEEISSGKGAVVRNTGIVWGTAVAQGVPCFMEDRIRVESSLFPSHAGIAATFVGIFDGHKGVQVAELLTMRLHDLLCERLLEAIESAGSSSLHGDASMLRPHLEQAFCKAFHAMDYEVIAAEDVRLQEVRRTTRSLEKPVSAGSTALVCLVWTNPSSESIPVPGAAAEQILPPPPPGGAAEAAASFGIGPSVSRTLITANVGDCRAVVSRRGEAIDLTRDHKADDAQEVQRVKAAGATIMNNRLEGYLAVTRSFGDLALKVFASEEVQQGLTFPTEVRDALITTPEMQFADLCYEDEFVVLASDGLWDVMSSQQAVNFVNSQLRNGSSPAETGQSLIEIAIQAGSTDNVSAVIVVVGGF